MEHQEHIIERYERAWIFFGLAMIAVFIILIAYMMMTMGNTNPVSTGRIDPTKVRTEGVFANPRVEQIGDEYVAYIQAFSFGYLPNEMRFKVGRKVTFYITAPDVQHGFQVEHTNINVQVIPGEIAKVSYTFSRPGEYRIICNEYCGIGHANMISKLVVEP
ncbi:cytochrome c oxidase subunit 2 [Meiothermus luteus]|jgi:cytochrome c oxidase subunit 2|uniref:cytochrome-c oxidase n=1 Tax=Meiothermus luteus TaxID=2026184 RepID=A0A399EZB4_9DEIN|nr:cytochrome C oxidase subunit II [Meiothermus luteus]RIH88369.1 cytochrome c oxidase subunit 2 [Meiothermus luteus]RMH56483.1 MAG: cytochrome C oxidase subunit II [Deinococcota bacterium]